MSEGAMSLDDDRISTLSEHQEVVLSTLFVVSGVLSTFGSFIIIHRIFKNGQTRSYDRLILGLTFSNIIVALVCIMTPFLLPEETSQRPWARGNDVTCSVLGWFTQLAYSSLWYNGMLSYYYLATLKYTISAEDFAARFEPYIHSLTPFFFLFTATAGFPFGVFTESRMGMGCWIGEFPKGCEATNDCNSVVIGWIFGGVVFFFSAISLPIINLVICVHLKRSLRLEDFHTASQKAYIRRVAIQGFLYVVTFFIAYLPQFVLRVLTTSLGYQASDEADIYWLLVLNSLLLPSQGFLNVFIFLWPIYARLKSAGQSTFRAMYVACFSPDIAMVMARKLRNDHMRLVPPSPKPPPPRVISPNKFTSLLETIQNDSKSALLVESSDKFETVSDEADFSDEPDSTESPSPPSSQPSSSNEQKKPLSILKKPKRMDMDGSISRSA